MKESTVKLLPGVPVSIGAGVWRLVAPNAGPMTGPGTNTYVLGTERNVVLDPGPAIDVHVDAILEACDGHLTHILVTHTHADHSPAAALLANRTGAQLIGMPPPLPERQDQSFKPERVPHDNELLALGEVSLRAIHTPGHASNHLCYLLDNQRLLFSGDHIMQGSTVVIPPPDGNMIDYLASLERIRSLAPLAIAPGHGTVITDSDRAVRRLVRHRLQREARVRDRLQQLDSATVEELLPLAYADVDERLFPVAAYSLHAHLLKLQEEGVVTCAEDRWSVIAR